MTCASPDCLPHHVIQDYIQHVSFDHLCNLTWYLHRQCLPPNEWNARGYSQRRHGLVFIKQILSPWGQWESTLGLWVSLWPWYPCHSSANVPICWWQICSCGGINPLAPTKEASMHLVAVTTGQSLNPFLSPCRRQTSNKLTLQWFHIDSTL